MSISRVNFLQKVSIILDDHWSSTTTSNGNAGGTTLIDSKLSKYPDGYFGDPNRDPQYWAYIGTTLRSVKDFVGNTGTLVLHNAYGSQIASSTAYSLHKYDRDKKILACNQALYECYPDYYLRVDDESTLDGLGSSDIDYTVPTTSGFVEFPDQIWSKHVSSTASDATITYTRITDYDAKLVNDAWKFYARISTGDDILLVGKAPLTQFGVSSTGDSGTTELTSIQANTVAYLAAAIFCDMMTNTVSAGNSGRFDALSAKFRKKYEELKKQTAMPRLDELRKDFGWRNE